MPITFERTERAAKCRKCPRPIVHATHRHCPSSIHRRPISISRPGAAGYLPLPISAPLFSTLLPRIIKKNYCTIADVCCPVLFCSSAVRDPMVGHTMDVLSRFLHLSLSSVVLSDSSTESPVHVSMSSIQAVRGLPRLHAPGIVPCIVSFSRQQLPCFLKV